MKASTVVLLALSWTLSCAVAQAPSVSKDCKGLQAQARAECLKVAKQMEKEAAQPHDPATTTPDANGPSADSVHHSSPVMATPDEKKKPAKTTPPK